MYDNDKLWIDIKEKSLRRDISQSFSIKLEDLQKILEKYKVLGDEKYGYIK